MQQVVLGVGVGAARGVELVLGVEQVEQAALADVELLAVGVARLLDRERVAVEVVAAVRTSFRVSLKAIAAGLARVAAGLVAQVGGLVDEVRSAGARAPGRLPPL